MITTVEGYTKKGIEFEEFLKTQKEIQEVMAGVFGEREKLLSIAVWNEFGTEKIPARPFLRKTFLKKKSVWLDYSESLVNQILDGKLNRKNALKLMGERMRDDIKKTMVDLKTPKNAPSTIKKKGFDDPLIDTKKLLNAVEYRVK